MHVGGVDGEWEFLATGSPFAQLAKGVGLSKTGEVVVSKATWALVEQFCDGARGLSTSIFASRWPCPWTCADCAFHCLTGTPVDRKLSRAGEMRVDRVHRYAQSLACFFRSSSTLTLT